MGPLKEAFMKVLAKESTERFLLPFYPFVHLIVNPFQVARSFWASRQLFWPFIKPGEDFSGFSATRGLLLWYRMQSDLFHKYGRNGRCPFLALGDFALSNWFYHALPSIYAFGRWGAKVPFLSMVAWLLSHAIWIGEAPTGAWPVGIVLAMIVVGTHFYAQIFVLQNYHALGWMFLPIGFYFVLTGDPLAASAIWLSMSIFSTIALAMAGIVVSAHAVAHAEWLQVLAFVPAGLKLLTHLGPNFRQGNFAASLRMLRAAVGSDRRRSKYKHTMAPLTRGWSFYHAAIFFQFLAVFVWTTREVPTLYVAAVVLFFVNRSFIKFHDVQSTQIMVVTTATASLLSNFDPWMLPSFWLLVSPLHQSVHVTFKQNRILPTLTMPPTSPFDVSPMLARARAFFAPVPQGGRVLMAFDNPAGLYDSVFDGLRWHFELLRYATAEREILLFPDWFAVFELNFEGAPEYWGRSPREVFDNAKRAGAGYCVVYDRTSEEQRLRQIEAGLDPNPFAEFNAVGFELLADFDWTEAASLLRGEAEYEKPLRLSLMRVPPVFNEIALIANRIAAERKTELLIAEIEARKRELLELLRAGRAAPNG